MMFRYIAEKKLRLLRTENSLSLDDINLPGNVQAPIGENNRGDVRYFCTELFFKRALFLDR